MSVLPHYLGMMKCCQLKYKCTRGYTHGSPDLVLYNLYFMTCVFERMYIRHLLHNAKIPRTRSRYIHNVGN